MAAIKEAVSASNSKIIAPDKLLAATTRDISQALWLVQSKSTSPEQRDAALLLMRSVFTKCSWIMRRLVVDVEAPEILEQFIRETYLNCALLQTGDKISRKRIKQIAQELPEFPILQSPGSQLREKVRLFLRSIDVSGKLPGGRRSTRWTNTALMWVAKPITEHLLTLMSAIPFLLNHPDASPRLQQLGSAHQNALSFFRNINFDISGQGLTLRNWPHLWNIISTLIVTEESAPRGTPEADIFRFCSWTDLYNNEKIREAVGAPSHQRSEAVLRSHIRDKIRKKIEAELGITKLRKSSPS